MKRILIIFSLVLIIVGCQKAEEKTDAPKADTGTVQTEYYAEYGIPDQNLIQPCSGDKELVRPVSKCTRRSTNVPVNVALCYSLPPVFMNVPSPGGQRQVPINGGSRLDSCGEGSIEIISTSYVCNPGFVFMNNRCQSYETVGSYAIQKDQIYREQNNLKILFTIGNDHSVKEQDGLQLIMFME